MKISLLKSLLAAAVVAVGFAAVPSTAEAGGSSHHQYSHKCGSCNGSIYKKRVVAYRDRCGRPVYRWVRLSHRCAPVRPPSCSQSHHGHQGHQKIHPAEVIVPILNFIASQQQQKQQQQHRSYPAHTAPRPPVSSSPYGNTPYGSGKSYDAGKSYDNGTSYSTSRSSREYRY